MCWDPTAGRSVACLYCRFLSVHRKHLSSELLEATECWISVKEVSSPLPIPHPACCGIARGLSTPSYPHWLFTVVPSDRTRGNGTNWGITSSSWTWGRTSLWGWRSTGTGCPGRLWSLLLCRCSRPAWTMSCAACCRWPCFGRGVGLDDPQRSLPIPTILWFCDSVILWFCDCATYSTHQMSNIRAVSCPCSNTRHQEILTLQKQHCFFNLG